MLLYHANSAVNASATNISGSNISVSDILPTSNCDIVVQENRGKCQADMALIQPTDAIIDEYMVSEVDTQLRLLDSTFHSNGSKICSTSQELVFSRDLEQPSDRDSRTGAF